MATALAGAVTVMELVIPAVRFAYRSPDGRLVVETVASLIAGLVALLFLGRFRRTGSRQALLLVYALGLLAVAALGFVVVPELAGARLENADTTWAPLVVRIAAAAFLLAAALTRDRADPRPRPQLSHHALVFVTLLVLLWLVVDLLAARLPTAVAITAPPEASGRPSFDAHPVVLVAQVAALLCFAVAAFRFTRQASSTKDDLAGWIGAACAVGAIARLNYVLYPSLYSGWLYTGDLLRLGFYVLLLVGAVRELQGYWAAQAQSAVADERRRLARELHDGALQEIGYIRTQVQGLDGPVAERVRSASERAMDETREALAALTTPTDESLAQAVRRRMSEIASRLDLTVQWSLEDVADSDAGHREDILRVAREAMTNAARHGRARSVHVQLRPGELVVSDDGTGFDTGANPRQGAFGLVSMRERAEAMSGTLQIRSNQHGTEIRLTWPTNP